MSNRARRTSIDERIGAVSERVVRRLNRRDALRRVILGGTTGLAALAIGASPAEAATACDCGPTRRCGHCPGAGCPPGQHLCKGSFSGHCFNSQGYRCEWPAGYWIACMNLGKGLGYKICYDCIGAGGCRDWCTCLSECICCGCSTPADIKAEQRKLAHIQPQ